MKKCTSKMKPINYKAKNRHDEMLSLNVEFFIMKSFTPESKYKEHGSDTCI
jgi:hypothetical protein